MVFTLEFVKVIQIVYLLYFSRIICFMLQVFRVVEFFSTTPAPFVPHFYNIERFICKFRRLVLLLAWSLQGHRILLNNILSSCPHKAYFEGDVHKRTPGRKYKPVRRLSREFDYNAKQKSKLPPIYARCDCCQKKCFKQHTKWSTNQDKKIFLELNMLLFQKCKICINIPQDALALVFSSMHSLIFLISGLDNKAEGSETYKT